MDLQHAHGSSVSLEDERGDGSRTERREAQIGRILDAARTCFLRSGFNGASMHDICAEAGMSPGALYRYFASKEALIEEICAGQREEEARAPTTIPDAPSLTEGVIRATLADIRHVHDSGLATLYAEIFAQSQRNPCLGETCNRSMRNVRDVFHTALSKGVETGEIDPVASVDSIMDVMMAMGHGLVIHDLPRQGVALETIEPVIRAIMVALLRPKPGDQTPDTA